MMRLFRQWVIGGVMAGLGGGPEPMPCDAPQVFKQHRDLLRQAVDDFNNRDAPSGD